MAFEITLKIPQLLKLELFGTIFTNDGNVAAIEGFEEVEKWNFTS